MFASLARIVNKYPKTIINAGLILLIVSIALGAQSFGKLKSWGFTDPAAQSTVAQNLIQSKLGGQANVVFLLHSRFGLADG
jgi:RND superfamily putative drug exporter